MEIKIGCGSGCCFLLFLVFLILKLCNVISWSWWWITSPLWIPFSITLILLILLGVLLVLALLFRNDRN